VEWCRQGRTHDSCTRALWQYCQQNHKVGGTGEGNDKFCLTKCLFHTSQRSLTTALLLLRRKACYRFLLPLKIHRPRSDLNPRTLGPMASTLTTRPPMTAAPYCVSIIFRNVWICSDLSVWPVVNKVVSLYELHKSRFPCQILAYFISCLLAWIALWPSFCTRKADARRHTHARKRAHLFSQFQIKSSYPLDTVQQSLRCNPFSSHFSFQNFTKEGRSCYTILLLITASMWGNALKWEEQGNVISDGGGGVMSSRYSREMALPWVYSLHSSIHFPSC
jgi:hypothetical protein